jgi:hypothetical protein
LGRSPLILNILLLRPPTNQGSDFKLYFSDIDSMVMNSSESLHAQPPRFRPLNY